MQPRPIAIVTGASRGIGEQFARRLSSRGYDLVLAARDHDALSRLGHELDAEHGSRSELVAVDLSTRDGVAVLEERITADPPPSLVVNNAGFGWHGRFADQPADNIVELIALDVLALTLLSRAAFAAMVKRGSGAILNVSSTASFVPGPTVAAYHASKAYVTSLTEALHVEAAPFGIHVTALCPGITPTGFQARAGTAHGHLPRFLTTTPERVVDEGLAALERNDAICVPGAINQFVAVASRAAPRSAVRWVAGKVTSRF